MFVLIFSLAGLMFVLMYRQEACDSDDAPPRNPTEIASESVSLIQNAEIDFNSFETLKADVKKQQVFLKIQSENLFYTVFTLILPDGTELWRSKELLPGECVTEMTLNKAMPAGEYKNAILRCESFGLDTDQTFLDSADIRVTLHFLSNLTEIEK